MVNETVSITEIRRNLIFKIIVIFIINIILKFIEGLEKFKINLNFNYKGQIKTQQKNKIVKKYIKR